MENTKLAKKEQPLPENAKSISYLRPHYEVHQDGDYTVKVYMPGVGKEGVDIVIDNKALSIEGIRQKSYVGENWRPRYREIPAADYRLRLELNIPVDENKISAKTEHGVLILTLPVEEAAKPRKITVG